MKLSQISLRYLKGQKKHTFMTVIAIVISVAFMTVLLAALSVYRSTSLNISRINDGTFHIIFNGLDKQQLVTIRSMGLFDETEIYSVSSYSSNTDVDYGQMADLDAKIEYLTIGGMPVDDVFMRVNADAVTMMPENMRTVIEGRLPEKEGEIVLSTASAAQWGITEIGSTLNGVLYTCGVKDESTVNPDNVPVILAESFAVEDISEVSFTVVGFSESSNIVDYNDTQLKSYSYLTDNLLARFNPKANDYYWNLHYTFADAGLEIDNFDYALNQKLLDLEGRGVTAKFNQMLFFSVMYLVILFFMFCIRMVIDNSFEISAKERIKQFGLLKAAGASKKQVAALVLWEAVYLAIPGVIAGIAVGIGCAWAVFSLIKNIPQLSDPALEQGFAHLMVFDIQPYVYISAAVIGVLWVVVSAISTGMRSIKASPVEAMRAGAKKDSFKPSKRRSKLENGGSFINAYAELSVKRNKKRYALTIVSMVMSIVLFTIFSYALEIADEKLTTEFEAARKPYDYVVNYSSFEPDSVLQIEEKMRQSGYFKDVQYDSRISVYSQNPGVSALVPITDESYPLIHIHPVNADTYNSFISAENGMSYDEFAASGRVLICDDMYDSEGNVLYSAYDVIPESISGHPYITSLGTFLEEFSFETAGGYSSSNRTYQSVDGQIMAVISADGFAALTEKYKMDSDTSVQYYEDGSSYPVFVRSIYANCAEGMEENARTFLKKNFYDGYEDNLSDRSYAYTILSIIRAGGYFIVAIITLIAVVNIVNIISTNVLNRNAEFAMLRACGMADSQLHGLILRESLIYAAVASAVSLLVTEAALFIIQIPFKTHYYALTFDDIGFEFSYIAPLKYILIASAAAFAVAAAASYLPARRLIRSSVVENIRNMENF